MEWCIMELITRKKHTSIAGKEDGLTLIEMMIAMVVLAVGILASMSLVVMAITGNSRSKQQTNSTALTQMVTEKIMSIPANQSPTLTITDCTNTSYNVSTTASSTGSGAPLTASGDVDYTQGKVNNYNMQYVDCGTLNRQMIYDVRWNLKTLNTIPSSPYVKLLTVSSRLAATGKSGSRYAPVVTIRTVIGLGT
jgi:prepilin-type N-terminal cleavage/methylation domain-containing protein